MSVVQQLDIRVGQLSLCSFSSLPWIEVQGAEMIDFLLTGVLEEAARTCRLLGPFECAVLVFKCHAQARSNDNAGRLKGVRPFDAKPSLLKHCVASSKSCTCLHQ